MRTKLLLLLASFVTCAVLGFRHFNGNEALIQSDLEKVALDAKPVIDFTGQLLPLWGLCNEIEQKKLMPSSDWEEISVRLNLLREATNKLVVASKGQQDTKTNLLVLLEKSANILPSLMDSKGAWMAAQNESEVYYGLAPDDILQVLLAEIEAMKKNLSAFKSMVEAYGKRAASALKTSIKALDFAKLQSKELIRLQEEFCLRLQVSMLEQAGATSSGYSAVEAEALLKLVLKSRLSCEHLFERTANRSKK